MKRTGAIKDSEMSFYEIGKELGISAQGAFNLYAKALKKLRQNPKARALFFEATNLTAPSTSQTMLPMKKESA